MSCSHVVAQDPTKRDYREFGERFKTVETKDLNRRELACVVRVHLGVSVRSARTGLLMH